MATPGDKLNMRAGGIFSYFVRHKTIANLLLFLMLAAGLLAFPNMRAQFFPDVVVDNVRVSVAWEARSASINLGALPMNSSSGFLPKA